jgi:CDP-glycerol glycerophosphotransferase (TagB/SpsB family)
MDDIEKLRKAVAELEEIRLGQDLVALSQRVKKRPVVLFFGRNTFSDNAKYLYLHALAREHDYEVLWCSFDTTLLAQLAQFSLPVFHLGENAERSLDLLLHAAVAVFCVNPAESLQGSFALNGALHGARRIQLWHGISVKHLKLELLPHFGVRDPVFRRHIELGTRFEYLLSPAACFDGFWHRSFGANKLIRAGFPRNEVIMRGPRTLEMVGSQMPPDIEEQLMQSERRNVLVVPTWQRHQMVHTTTTEFVTQCAMYARQHQVNFFIKLHPLNFREHGEVEKRTEGLFLLNPGTDIYPWMSNFDALVTDYSSIMFDFLLTGRPILTLDIPPGSHRDFEPDYSLVPEGRFRTTFTPETFEQELTRALHEDTLLPERIAYAQQLFETDPNKACEQLMSLVDQLVAEACADEYSVISFG